MGIFNKFKKDAIWLLPGLRVKRWFILTITGAVLAALGLAFLFKMEPIYFLLDLVKKIINFVPPEVIGIILIVAGAIIFIASWQKTNFSMLDVKDTRGQDGIREVLYRRMKLDHGPKIVAIGGGTGLSTMLRGIKKITNNITAVVTVGDDGGSSGKLREEMGIIPPGDVRQCIAALADDDDIVTKLFKYRFDACEGLEGHSFGNLFITAMSAICGDMVTAIKESSKVLLIRGRVLPATADDMRLTAVMEDGSIVKGESKIPEAKKKIETLSCEPRNCTANKEALDAIADADLIIMGPGSLYTSIIPNLLVEDITRAVDKSKAKKIYVCNVMTQPGETDNYSASDHVKALFKHAQMNGASNNNFVDAVLINDSMPENLAKKYEEKDSLPVDVDIAEIKKMGLEVIIHKLIEDNKDGLVRHSPRRLARAIYYWYRKEKKRK
ncbi:MAG: YvcK family protein [Cyanobacteria bacterium SIG30]|nr:YvcK family protein [Cyanobacteria bacterium SIG30]